LLIFAFSLLSLVYSKRLPSTIIDLIVYNGVIYKVVRYSIDQVESIQNCGVIEI